MMKKESAITLRDWQEAIGTVQDACNLSGVVFSYARVMQHICDEAFIRGYDSEWKNTHPIAVLYADKIADLTHARPAGVSDYFTRAYTYVQAILDYDRRVHERGVWHIDHVCCEVLA